jgi:NADP-dependent 3-hydroxy acid dehydrogenase YdfG
MENNFKGKVVVITGASSGMGEAAAKHLSGLGQRLYWVQEEPTELKSWPKRSVTTVEKRLPSLWT